MNNGNGLAEFSYNCIMKQMQFIKKLLAFGVS